MRVCFVEAARVLQAPIESCEPSSKRLQAAEYGAYTSKYDASCRAVAMPPSCPSSSETQLSARLPNLAAPSELTSPDKDSGFLCGAKMLAGFALSHILSDAGAISAAPSFLYLNRNLAAVAALLCLFQRLPVPCAASMQQAPSCGSHA